MKRYKITTGTYHNDGPYDGECIGTSVDYEWLHGEPTAADFPGWEITDWHETGVIIERFDAEYDRSTEEYLPVYYSAFVSLDDDTETE